MKKEPTDNFDFSNIGDQKTFEEPPEKEREELIGVMQEIVEDEHAQGIEKEKKEKIIVEIGHGGRPIYKETYDVIKKEIKENDHYIGIEVLDSPNNKIYFERPSTGKLKRMKERSGENKNVQGKIDFIAGSGEALPLKNESADQIVFKDVFGYNFKNEDVSREIEIKKNLIDEALRVLKEGGELEIIETYSPEVSTEDILDLFKNSKVDFYKFIPIIEDEKDNLIAEKEINKEELLREIKLSNEGLIKGLYFNKGRFEWSKPFRIIFLKK